MRSTPIITGLLFVAAGVYVLGVATLLLWLSGDWRWVEGWIFGVWLVSFIAAILLWLHYKDPRLLAERMRMPGSGGESRSDMAILIGVKVAGSPGSFYRRWTCVSAGCRACRYGARSGEVPCSSGVVSSRSARF